MPNLELPRSKTFSAEGEDRVSDSLIYELSRLGIESTEEVLFFTKRKNKEKALKFAKSEDFKIALALLKILPMLRESKDYSDFIHRLSAKGYIKKKQN